MPNPNAPISVTALADVLTNPTAKEADREQAGQQLVLYMKTPAATYDRLAETVIALGSGIARIKGLGANRRPPNYADIVFTDRALVQITAIVGFVGDRLIILSDRSTSQDERDLVDDLIESQGLEELFTASCEELRDKSYDESVELVSELARNMQSIKDAGDDVISGQSVRVDLPLYVLGQMVRAAAWRLDQFTKYTPPF